MANDEPEPPNPEPKPESNQEPSHWSGAKITIDMNKTSVTSKKPEKHRLYKPAEIRHLICGCKDCKKNPARDRHMITYYIPPKEILSDVELEDALIDMIE